MARESTVVEIDGRRLTVSNLDKVLYPGSGTTKGEVIAYYNAIAPTLLPHLSTQAGHPQTLAGRYRRALLLPEGPGSLRTGLGHGPAAAPR